MSFISANDSRAINPFINSSKTSVLSEKLVLYYCEQWKRIKKEIERLEHQQAMYKKYISEYMGDKEELRNDNGYLFCSKTTYSRNQFNTTSFRGDYPDLYKNYTHQIQITQMTLKI